MLEAHSGREETVNETENTYPKNRLIFFDNLRYLLVLLILVFHSGASYGSMVAFWPYHDPHPTEFIDNKIACVDFVEDETGSIDAVLAAGLDES